MGRKRDWHLRIVVLILGVRAVAGCSGRAHSSAGGSATESEGETVLIPDCQDYARKLHACLDTTGVPAKAALAAADSNARAPVSLDDTARELRRAGCARERALLAQTCR